MKLRNKKTGEIGKISKQLSEDNQLEVITDNKLYVVKSLTELNAEWEDYEENEYYYAITSIKANGGITMMKNKHNYMTAFDKSIGNYFETREEAEKAVERLRAWKRLKDKGFKITLHDCEGNAWLEANWGNLQGDYSDVLLLFGGEE